MNLKTLLFPVLLFTGPSLLISTPDAEPDLDPLTLAPRMPHVTVPDETEWIEALRERYPDQQHPRLMLTAERIETLRKNVVEDEACRVWFDHVVTRADALLTTRVQPDQISRRDTLHRMYNLGLAWHLTGNEAYAERAWKEMEAVAAFRTWYANGNIRDFLGIAYIGRGMAVGYDWFYDYLTPEQRQIVRDAIVGKALRYGQYAYERPGESQFANDHWIRGAHNWNPTSNGSLAMAAIAVADEEPEAAGPILPFALRSIQVSLPEFSPDGAWKEGAYYWYFSTNSMVELCASLDSTFGHDFGLSDTPGFDRTGRFPLFMNGPTGLFNWGDSDPVTNLPEEIFWLADRYDDPELKEMYLQRMEAAGDGSFIQGGIELFSQASRALLYYNPSPRTQIQVSSSALFRGTESVGMCNHWENPLATYVGVKGGTNPVEHGSLSLGTFVLDAGGERWVQQLGPENYSLPGYWDYDPPAGQRWTYYRMRAEGQNTIIRDPGRAIDQGLPAVASATLDSTTNTAVVDMTEALGGSITRATRTMHLDKDDRLTLRDQVELTESTNLQWAVHTAAEVQISPDGRTANLQLNDMTMEVTLETDLETATFAVKPAQADSRSPKSRGNSPNVGISKLVVAIEADQAFELKTTFALQEPPASKTSPDPAHP